MKRFFHIYQHGIGALNYALFLLMLISIPFPSDFLFHLWPIWLVSWVLEMRFVQPSNKRINGAFYASLAFVAFLGWNALSILWSDYPKEGWKCIERSLSICVLPLIALYGVNEHYKVIKMQVVYIAGCIISIFAYALIIYWCGYTNMLQYFDFHWYGFLSDGPISLIKHHGFYSIALLAALGMSGAIYQHFKQRYSCWSAAITTAIADLILIVGCICSNSRTALLLLPILALAAFCIYFNGKHKVWLTTLFIGCIVGLVYLSSFHPRMQIIKQSMHSAIIDKHIDEQTEPRIYIFSTVLKHWKDYGWAGMGIGSPQPFLKQQYAQDPQAPSTAVLGWHPHNQYFNTWMSIGPLGMVVLLAIVILMPLFFAQSVRPQAIFLSLNYGWAMLTDLVLSFACPLYTFLALFVILATQSYQQSSGTDGPLFGRLRAPKGDA